jgi:hypothetical protein
VYFSIFISHPMIPTVPLVLYLASCTFAQTPLPNPPKLPGNYPGIDQTVMISGASRRNLTLIRLFPH